MSAALKNAMAKSLARRGVTNMNYGAPVVEGKGMPQPLPPSRMPVPVSVAAAAASNGTKTAANVDPQPSLWNTLLRHTRALGGVTGALEADEKATGEPLRGGAKKRRQTGKRRRSLRNKRRKSRRQRKQQKH